MRGSCSSSEARVDWSKTSEEGIMTRNSFCVWIGVVISTLQKELAFQQATRTFGSIQGRKSSAELLALLGMWPHIRHILTNGHPFDQGITCSAMCRGSSSTLCMRKCQIRDIHYLRLSW